MANKEFIFEDGKYKVGLEIETLDYHDDFFKLSFMDGSGPREIFTQPYTDPVEIFEEVKNLHFGMSGESLQDRHGSRRGKVPCGSHIHLGVPEGDELQYYRIFRYWTPFWAPFFAGSPLYDPNADFAFRKDTSWFNVPDVLTPLKITNWRGSQKRWWCTPHKVPKWKLHFEFRLNEALPQSSVIPLKIMSYLAEFFIREGIEPFWSPDLLTMCKEVVQSASPLNKVSHLKTILTKDKVTAQIVSQAFDLDYKPQRVISLRQILRRVLKLGIMRGYEIHWIRNVLKGNTWSKMIHGCGSNREKRIALTRQNIRRYKKTNYKILPLYKFFVQYKNFGFDSLETKQDIEISISSADLGNKKVTLSRTIAGEDCVCVKGFKIPYSAINKIEKRERVIFTKGINNVPSPSLFE